MKVDEDADNGTPHQHHGTIASSSKNGRRDGADGGGGVRIARYRGEVQMAAIMGLIDEELSEPYTVFTYRYFLNQWPHLCFLAHDDTQRQSETEAAAVPSSSSSSSSQKRHALDRHDSDARPIGVVIGKLDRHMKGARLMRGYIGMVSVHAAYRGRGIATRLLHVVLAEMVKHGAQEIVLETEIDNVASLRLYERLGFMREKRLFNFYLNGKDCFRLILPIPTSLWQAVPSAISPSPSSPQPQPPPLPPPLRTVSPTYGLDSSVQAMRIAPDQQNPPRAWSNFSLGDIL